MNNLLEMLPLLIPLLLIDIALAVAAVGHILQHSHYRFGSQTLWLVLVVMLLFFGPIVYFVLGKSS